MSSIEEVSHEKIQSVDLSTFNKQNNIIYSWWWTFSKWVVWTL